MLLKLGQGGKNPDKDETHNPSGKISKIIKNL